MLINKWHLLPSALLTVAHIITSIALLTFGVRANGYPLHPIGLIIYLTATALSFLALCFRQTQAVPSNTAHLLLVSVPALTSLIFQAALWMTPWLGGAAYTPYDSGDADLVWFFSLFFAIVFSAVAIFYGSPGYLLVACIIQLGIYFGTHGLPHWLIYPYPEVLLGPRVETLVQLVGVYLFSAIVLLGGQQARSKPKGAWPATAIISLAGAWVLYNILSWLPGNGAYLGYISRDALVLEYAWDWSRPAAQMVAAVAMASSLLLGAIAVLRQIQKVVLLQSR